LCYVFIDMVGSAMILLFYITKMYSFNNILSFYSKDIVCMNEDYQWFKYNKFAVVIFCNRTVGITLNTVNNKYMDLLVDTDVLSYSSIPLASFFFTTFEFAIFTQDKSIGSICSVLLFVIDTNGSGGLIWM